MDCLSQYAFHNARHTGAKGFIMKRPCRLARHEYNNEIFILNRHAYPIRFGAHSTPACPARNADKAKLWTTHTSNAHYRRAKRLGGETMKYVSYLRFSGSSLSFQIRSSPVLFFSLALSLRCDACRCRCSLHSALSPKTGKWAEQHSTAPGRRMTGWGGGVVP